MTIKWEEREQKFWKPEKSGDQVTGIYMEYAEPANDQSAAQHTLSEGPNKHITLWGSTVLDGKMKRGKIGEQVRITYLGKAESKKGATYFNYKVEWAKPVAMPDIVQPDA